MVLAAGLGKRLRPVTIRTPKALIPVRGKPLLQWALDKLGRVGADPIYVNVHHHAPFVRTFLSQIETAEEIRVVEEDPVLETGGGIRNVARMMETDAAGGKTAGGSRAGSDTSGTRDSLLIHNADVLSSLPLDRFQDAFESGKYDAYLAVQTRKTSRPIAIDSEGLLSGRFGEEPVRPADSLTPVGYSGILAITHATALALPGEGSFPLIDSLLALIQEGARVGTYPMDGAYWTDVGTMKRWTQVEHDLANGVIAPEALA